MRPLSVLNTQTYIASGLRQVDAVCEAFDREGSLNAARPFDDYFKQAPAAHRVTLLRNMLHIDLRRRKAAGEQPNEDEYVARLPEYADVIRAEFLASTQTLASPLDTETFSPAAKNVELGSVVRLGDYLLEKELGRGAMGIVFAASHLRHGTRVALKTLPTVEAQELHRFKREFRTLADLNHPNLVGLHTLQSDAGQWFFTMDLVEGEDFRSYVRPGSRLDLARLRSACSQLAVAVHFLHGRQIIHRDPKPSNVMVSREGELRVLDFGLALGLDPLLAAGVEEEVAGTPAYMAPEQLGVASTMPASDWYAMGVMLYEALSGKLPFSGSVAKVLADKQTQDAPAICGEVPEDLAKLCQRLLSRLPEDRPEAAEILHIACPGRVDQATVVAGSLAKGRLMGRERQLQELDREVRSFEEQGAARTVFIIGKSGEGKTVLAERLLDRFRRDPGYLVLAGRCYDRESVPFKAVDALVDALCARLKSMSDEQVRRLLPPEAAVLAELFPVLNRVDEVARLPRVSLENLELERVRRLAADALRELLRRLSENSRLVCFIDDLQWGDAASAALLLEVLRQPEAPNVFMLATYRSDEAGLSPFLQAWEIGRQQRQPEFLQTECRLKPLEAEQCLRFVLDIVGVDTQAVRQRAREMAEETGGNPFLLSELASCYDPHAETSHPMQMEEVLERKLTLLPRDARELLDVVSVSGKALRLDEAARTAGHAAVPLSTFSRMRTERLVRMTGGDEEPSVDTYHDRIRETVLRDMGAAERRRWHVRLAEEIEVSIGALSEAQPAAPAEEPGDARTNPRVYDLAYHFFEGADSRAFGYQLQAGEAATRAYAMETAIEHFSKAEQIMPDTADRPTRYRLWERMGEASIKAQRLPQSLKAYEAAQAFASSDVEQAAVHDGIGETQQRMGDFDAAIASLDKALGALGYRRPKELPRTLIETSWLLSRCQFPGLVRPRKTEEARRRAKLASDVLQRHAQIFLLRGDMARIADCCARIAITALHSGRVGSIAVALSKLGFNSANYSLQWSAKWMLGRAMQFAERCDDAHDKAVFEALLGASHYCFGRLQDAERLLLTSLSVLDRFGESWHRVGFHHALRHVYSVEGRSEDEIAAAQMEYAIGKACLDPEAISWGEYGQANAKARLGRLPEAHSHMTRAMAAIEGRGSKLSEAVALNHYGFVRLQSSDYSGAADAFERSRRIFEKGCAYLEYVIYTYPGLIEALAGPNWLEPRHDAGIRRAKKLSLWSRFFGWRFPNVQPCALRAHGRLLCASGQRRQAVRCFKKAVDNSRRLGAEYVLARSLLDLAAVSKQDCEALRAEGIAALKRIHAVIPHAEKWQLGETPDLSCVAPLWDVGAPSVVAESAPAL